MRTRQILTRLALGAVLVTGAAACGGDDDSAGGTPGVISVSDAWSREPAAGQSTSAVYVVVSNGTDADVTITGATTPVTDRAELHETIANADGSMTMREAKDGFVVPAGGSFAFESGGPHIMLFDIDSATYPDAVQVTLQFDGADPVTFDAEVRALPGDDMSGMTGMDDGSMDDGSMDDGSMDDGSMDDGSMTGDSMTGG